ncbi:beta-ketoacyl synthase N-terminal-like domain-containing protein [Streptomyces sp. NPDC002523]
MAIVGMACRVAGADDWRQWWNNLLKGDRAIGPVPVSRLAGLAEGAPEIRQPYAAVLDDPAGFDATFFGLSRRMAAWMDPQQRIMLELSWHALEDAGISPESLAGQEVAVFAATWVSEYRDRMLQAGLLDGVAAIGTLPTFLANRISYQYGLTGPSMSLDTACSAGLTAFASAVRGIQHGDFPMALVGAVNVLCSGFISATGYRSGLLSRSGSSVPFGQDADGYIRGEGGACLVLKRLSDAVDAGDPVLAVVRGVSMNHDGRGGGLTAPDAASHTRLIRDAIARSGIEPSSIGYLEAHGPGTSTGDPVEVRGLRDALAADGMPERMAGPDGHIWIGSAKGNVGHLEAAAGLIGLVKAVLTLREERIIGIPGLSTVNSGLPLDGTPIAVADRDVPWPSSGGEPRRVAVSSFGLGGSNAHAILEEAMLEQASTCTRPSAGGPYAVPLSAPTAKQLRSVALRLHDALAGAAPPRLDAVAWTMQSGRAHLPVRALVLAEDAAGLRERLHALAESADAATDPIPAGVPHAETLRAWLAGSPIDWTPLWPSPPPRRIPLPGYPFDRKPHWFSPAHPLDQEVS